VGARDDRHRMREGRGVISATPPAFVIEIPLEASPRVLMRAMTSGEEDRLVDWIRSHDELAMLIARAIEIAEGAQAA
jgi:hypothetical protein